MIIKNRFKHFRPQESIDVPILVQTHKLKSFEALIKESLTSSNLCPPM